MPTVKSVSVNLGDRLRQLRDGKGWSQRDLAREARVHPNSVSQWERGRRKKLDGWAAQKLAAAFGLSVQELLQDVDDLDVSAAPAMNTEGMSDHGRWLAEHAHRYPNRPSTDLGARKATEAFARGELNVPMPPCIHDIIGGRINDYFGEHRDQDIGVEELAHVAGVEEEIVRSLENGWNDKFPLPDVTILRRIATAMGCSLAYLIGDTDDPKPGPIADAHLSRLSSGYWQLKGVEEELVDAYRRQLFEPGLLGLTDDPAPRPGINSVLPEATAGGLTREDLEAVAAVMAQAITPLAEAIAALTERLDRVAATGPAAESPAETTHTATPGTPAKSAIPPMDPARQRFLLEEAARRQSSGRRSEQRGQAGAEPA